MPIGCLLVGEGDAQQHSFAERLAYDLHAYGQIVSKTGGYRDGRDSSYAYGQRAYIAQIHLHRVFQLFAQLEGHGRRGRGDQGVISLKDLVKFLFYKGAYLLRFHVVSVVIACGQSIGTQHYAPFDLRAETELPRPLRCLDYIAGISGRKAVFHPVVAGQVRLSLRRGNYVIGSQRVLSMWQRDTPIYFCT